MCSKKKILSSVATVVAVVLLCSMSVSAAPGKTFTIDAVAYDGTALIPSQEFSTITDITYTDDGTQTTVTIASDEVATLVVDGIQYDIAAGDSYTYADSAQIVVTTKDETNYFFNPAAPGAWLYGYLIGDTGPEPATYYLRATAFIDGGSLLTDYSVLETVISGAVTDTGATDVVIDSEGSYFNGIYINDSAYGITGLDMTLVGNGGDDFNGWGAGLMTTGTSEVTVDGAIIDTTGAIRTAIWAGGESEITVTDSVIVATGADEDSEAYENLVVPMLKRVPWVLGLEGNTRATNVLGGATANYSDSIVVSSEWGALSTDSGRTGTNALNVDNVLAGIGTLEVAKFGRKYCAVKEVDGVLYGFNMSGSGYVSYADAGVINYYENVEFYAPDYAVILASGTSSAYFLGEDTTVETKRVGALMHKNLDGVLSITDGRWTADDIMFLVKSTNGDPSYPNVIVDGTKFNIRGKDSYSGVLYQLMDTDDAGGPFIDAFGIEGYTIPDEEDDWSSVTAVEEETTAADATFIGVNVKGDIYNSVYTLNEDLNVTLQDSKITGIISSSNANHVDEAGNVLAAGTVILMADEDGYLGLGRVVNTPSAAVNNDVNLTLENTMWKVAGTSYLSSLSIDDGSKIAAEKGHWVTMTVDGVDTEIEAGYYDGDIVIECVRDLGGKKHKKHDKLPICQNITGHRQ